MLADSSTITSGIQLLNKFVTAMGSIAESALPVPAAIAAVYTALKKAVVWSASILLVISPFLASAGFNSNVYEP